MEQKSLLDQAASLAEQAKTLADTAKNLASSATQIATQSSGLEHFSFMSLFTIFVLSCFIGYYVVWRVTPALHSPLMAITNAISSVIIVGALFAVGASGLPLSQILGFVAVMLAAINIFGGFVVTQRMLAMFKKKQK